MHRWVPVSLSEARWDPGRPGALLLAVVTALAAVLAAVGVWSNRPVPEPVPALPMLPAVAAAAPSAASSAASSTGPPGELVVSVVGKVAEPGLVQVTDGARVADAIEAAGGALPGTDVTALNLARLLADGEQLLVGIDPPPGEPNASGAAGSANPTGRVNLNTATVEELDTLPGIGPVTAQRIVDWRATNGRFTSVDQLLEVSGIGDSKLAQLEGLVRV